MTKEETLYLPTICEKNASEKLDRDLNRLLDYVWKKNPYPDKTYVDLVAKLLIVQELRTLNKTLNHKEGMQQ